MAQMVADALQQVGANFVDTLADLLPRALITFSIVAVGWLIAMLLKIAVRFVLGRLHFNAACDRMGVAHVLKTADAQALLTDCKRNPRRQPDEPPS